MISLESVALPDFGLSEDLPPLPLPLYEARLQATVDRLQRAGLQFLAVYADREHSANLSFLTGFDPRFEEALLLLDTRGRRRLLVGNECLGYLPDARLGIETELFQELSLLGQPRDKSRPLRTILREFGITGGTVVGCAGWKYFESPNIDSPPLALEVPAWLADALRTAAGAPENVRNATALFMHPDDGLRTVNPTGWYEAVKIGITGGEVFARVDAVRRDDLFAFAVNPGHSVITVRWPDQPRSVPGRRCIFFSSLDGFGEPSYSSVCDS